jgi:hypothetical protein
MNVLCDKVWIHCEDNLPTVENVDMAWKEYVLQEESKIAKELSSLNTSQKKILIAVSQGTSKDLTSKETLRKFNLTSAAVVKSLKLLEEQDYLNRNNKGEYFLVDPLIKSSLMLFNYYLRSKILISFRLRNLLYPGNSGCVYAAQKQSFCLY